MVSFIPASWDNSLRPHYSSFASIKSLKEIAKNKVHENEAKKKNLPTKNKKIETTKKCKRNFTNTTNETVLRKIIQSDKNNDGCCNQTNSR